MYDLIILGAGPAGLTASIYASRYKINHVVIGSIFEGSATRANFIENWPGEKSIKGSDLIMKFADHAKSLKAEIIQGNVVELKKKDGNFVIKTDDDRNYDAKSILISFGTKNKRLNIPGEEKFLGKGISYCAVCDGAFFKDKIVAVVGGSNSAAMAATMLSEHASKVYLIYRKDVLKCEPIVLERMEKNEKIEIIYNTNVIKVEGEKKVEFIEIDKKHNEGSKIKINGLFIEIGAIPSVSLVKELGVKTDENDCVIIDNSCGTNIDGIFAAGDITNGSNNLRQVITAASEGAVAATSIYKYLKEK